MAYKQELARDMRAGQGTRQKWSVKSHNPNSYMFERHELLSRTITYEIQEHRPLLKLGMFGWVDGYFSCLQGLVLKNYQRC